MTDPKSILIPKISFPEQDVKVKRSFFEKLKMPKIGRAGKIVLSIVVVFLFFFAIVGILAYDTYAKAKSLRVEVAKLETAVKDQDMTRVKENLSLTKTSLLKFQKSFNRLGFLKITPFVGFYIEDGMHGINAAKHGLEAGDLILAAVEPYADIIGFKAGGGVSESGLQETTQERIDFIVKTIPDLVPKADAIIEKAKLIDGELAHINPSQYPNEVRGVKVKSLLTSGLESARQILSFVENGKPLLESAPYLLGSESERTYLVLFQNDKELRPTGGFLTAYTLSKVSKGKFEPVGSSDIYNLDASYTPKVKAPEPIIKYLKGPYLLSSNYRLRDMNWSPDFRNSMELFMEEAKTAGIDGVDGVIAVDTQVLVNILDVIGPIDVPEFGKFSTEITPECNCPQVIYELESFADVEGPIVWSENEPGKIVYAPPNYDNRKKIIGPLMNSILSHVLGQPKEKIPLLFGAGMKSLTEKHVLLYVFDEKVQKAVQDFGIAGTIRSDYDGDYLHISDANLGGRKSNLYATSEVTQEIERNSDGSIIKTLTITYKNPEKHDGWLNSVLPNYVRIYVPQGSELISFDGAEEKFEPYEELDKTVFAGFFQLRPQGVSKLTIKYKLPQDISEGKYRLLIQKQPGTDSPLYSIKIGKKQDEFFLKTDREFTSEI